MVYLSALGLNCALGANKKQVANGLWKGSTEGMQPLKGWVPEHELTCGVVSAELPSIDNNMELHTTRNNQLLLQAALQINLEIQQVIQQLGNTRIGVVLGTSTSGIHESGLQIAEFINTGNLPDDYSYLQQELADPAMFLSHWFGLNNMAYTVSTACTSGARALMSAKRLIETGICDAVLCGGVDSLCRLTLNGFSSLEAVSESLCNPFSKNRTGINLGEGAALFLMTKSPLFEAIPLLGVGASADAYHISAPEPDGKGAIKAMQVALMEANLLPEAIDYLNLHGTATQHNDAMEARAVNQELGVHVRCSSTKPLTGHTLGAAGALEAAFCWLTLQNNYNPQHLLPLHRWDGEYDPALPKINLVQDPLAQPINYAMSNSFAFGGNNTSLILGRLP